ncbi:hypothetical protein HQ545_08020 [Candidatus Woesearchaeota archaeon]|nr:hypothetical protein [Candidatus Woesearchaeota archaeon]
MGLMDRFRKKEDDDFSDLGDFGLDDPSPAPGLGGDNLSPLGDMPGMAREEVHPTDSSMQIGQQIGIDMQPQQQQQPMQQQTMQQQPIPSQTGYVQQGPAPIASAQQNFKPHEPGLNDLAKDVEIIHAKLDAIKSSLDSVNQRLATIERIASGDNKSSSRYTW